MEAPIPRAGLIEKKLNINYYTLLYSPETAPSWHLSTVLSMLYLCEKFLLQSSTCFHIHMFLTTPSAECPISAKTSTPFCTLTPMDVSTVFKNAVLSAGYYSRYLFIAD